MVVLAALVVASCGGGSTGDGSGDAAPTTAPSTSTPAPTPVPEDPTLTAPPGGKATGTQRYTGVVERSVEDRCLTLSTAGRTWVLTGTVAGLSAGDRVTVRGRPDPDATTTCQRGPVLVVVEVERG